LKRSNRLMLVFGVLLAVVAFGGVLLFGAGSGTAQPAAPTTVKVVTAAADVSLGTALTLTELGTVDMDIALSLDTYHESSQLVGMVVRRTVHQGDAFKTTDFLAAPGVSAADVTSGLKAGQVAVAISVDQVAGVGSLIQAGDSVDVMLALSDQPEPPRAPVVVPLKDPVTGYPWTPVPPQELNNTSIKVLVQNVQVLGLVGGSSSASAATTDGTDSTAATDPNTGQPAVKASIVILSVTPQEAELVRFAQLDGNLSLLLRSPGDAGAADVKTTGVTLRELVDHYGVLPPRVIDTTP
jgi:Flp pilus assembly protein CpaB